MTMFVSLEKDKNIVNIMYLWMIILMFSKPHLSDIRRSINEKVK